MFSVCTHYAQHTCDHTRIILPPFHTIIHQSTAFVSVYHWPCVYRSGIPLKQGEDGGCHGDTTGLFSTQVLARVANQVSQLMWCAAMAGHTCVSAGTVHSVYVWIIWSTYIHVHICHTYSSSSRSCAEVAVAPACKECHAGSWLAHVPEAGTQNVLLFVCANLLFDVFSHMRMFTHACTHIHAHVHMHPHLVHTHTHCCRFSQSCLL